MERLGDPLMRILHFVTTHIQMRNRGESKVTAHNLGQIGRKQAGMTEACSQHVARSDSVADSQDGLKCERLLHFFFAISFALMACACVAPPEELMEKIYTRAEMEALCSQRPKRCVDIGDKLYFIDEGFVFSYNPIGLKEYIDGYNVSEIVAYKNSLVALRENGQIFLYAIEKSDWIKIGNSAKSIVSNDTDLVALTKNGEIWAYLGEPGDLQIVYIPTIIFIDDIPTIIFIPTVGGREVAFEEVDIPDTAIGLGVRGGDIVIELERGELLTLRDGRVQR